MQYFSFLSTSNFMVIKIRINLCQMTLFCISRYGGKKKKNLFSAILKVFHSHNMIHHYWGRKKNSMAFSHVTGLGFSGHLFYKLHSLWTHRSYNLDLWWANFEMADHLYLHVPTLGQAQFKKCWKLSRPGMGVKCS